MAMKIYAAATVLAVFISCLLSSCSAFSIRPPSTPMLAPSGGLFCSRNSAVKPLYSSTNNGIVPLYDELMEKLPSKQVIKAIEKSKGPVVASDLATSAGISLSQARKDLTTLASLTRGDIAVSSDGDLIYTFPNDINSVLSANSAKFRAMTTWKEKIFPPLFYATKVGFGVVLLVSLFAIFSTLFFVMTSGGGSNRDDDRRDDRRGGGMPM